MQITVTSFQNQNGGFDEESQIYMCCCGCIHSRIGALIFAVIDLIINLIILGVLVSLIYDDVYGHETYFIVIIALFLLLLFASISLTIYGIKVQRPLFLIPYAVMQSFNVLSGVACLFWFFIHNEPTKKDGK